MTRVPKAVRWSDTVRVPLSGRFLLRRLLQGLLAVWMAVTGAFVFLNATGSPERLVAPPDASQEEIDRIAAAYGFDQPLPRQYVDFFVKTFTGSFPDSVNYHVPAIDVVLDAVPATALLGSVAFVAGNLLGLLIGYVSATSRWWPLRSLPLGLSRIGHSLPAFYLALLLVILFSVHLRVLPSAGYGTVENLILPATVLTIGVLPGAARLYRAQVLETAGEDHVITAVAKGVSRNRVLLRHVGLNALGPALSLMGIQLGGLIAGAVTIEVIFRWPGVGSMLIDAVNDRDYSVALTGVLLVAVAYILATLVTDILAALVDPLASRRA
ncbi:ABC transporter permease [Acrocarpospora catenulata]|uniref:ABC transporter permease n=1 Tax=Acrocarpospora catenulata TaxID=2836182 RepID=UPI001BD91B06|nr:ABC transporter permease [Acrocarpospora catenulata]